MLLFTLLYKLPALLLCLTVHEFMHGYVAYRLGDTTAKEQGRLTFNPIKHLDPFGTLAIIFLPFGWAKPVPVNPYRFRNPRRDMVIVGVAGPIANFIAAFIVAKLLLLGGVFTAPYVATLIDVIVMINVALGIFNLLPIPPLDGSKIIPYLLPESMQQGWYKFEQYGFLILLVLVFMIPNSLAFINVPINYLMPFMYAPLPVPSIF
ncbi:MAG TPA: site-2 protease family protein [Candidatus Aquicultor sp.]|jgi:Zn-dependent protease